MKKYWGVTVHSRFFLTSALVGGEWSASRPGRFNPGETALGTYWIGVWVDHRPDRDDLEKRIFLTLSRLVQPVASPYADCAIPAAQRYAIPVTGREGQ
jgi:hypothetical protein